VTAQPTGTGRPLKTARRSHHRVLSYRIVLRALVEVTPVIGVRRHRLGDSPSSHGPYSSGPRDQRPRSDNTTKVLRTLSEESIDHTWVALLAASHYPATGCVALHHLRHPRAHQRLPRMRGNDAPSLCACFFEPHPAARLGHADSASENAADSSPDGGVVCSRDVVERWEVCR
jgi:hypothetical protein